MGFLAEGFVFSYLGLTFFSYRFMPFSISMISIELCIVILGRGLATIGLIGLLKCCGYEKKHPQPLTFKELTFIWYAGMIRGAIAFGLVLRIDKSHENRNLIVTTCLALVLITTIVFGSTVGLLSVCLFPKNAKAGVKAEIVEQGEDSNEADDAFRTVSSGGSSDRSQILHPNQEDGVSVLINETVPKEDDNDED